MDSKKKDVIRIICKNLREDRRECKYYSDMLEKHYSRNYENLLEEYKNYIRAGRNILKKILLYM